MNLEKQNPLVSVVCFTYNHEKYIRNALDGFLMQQTDFPVEIIVHDDASTDGTTEIVRQYAARHPDLIRPIYRRQNLYSNGRRCQIHQDSYAKARGKYIAWCEGDDYWTDPKKLQKQVAVLEGDETASFCFHDVMVVRDGCPREQYSFYQDLPRKTGQYARPAVRVELKDIISGNFIATGSVLARRAFLLPLPDWFANLPAGDWGLFIHLLHSGCGVYIDQLMGTYRLHSGSLWSSRNPLEIHALWIKEMHLVQRALNEPFRSSMQNKINESANGFMRTAAGVLRRTCQREGPGAAKKQAHKLAALTGGNRIKARTLLFAAFEQLFLHASNSGDRYGSLAAYWQCLRTRPGYLLDRHSLRRVQRILMGAP